MDMNFILSGVIFILFIFMTIKSALSRKKLLVKFMGTKLEKNVVLLISLVIAIVTIIYSKRVLHYLVGLSAISMIIATWLNQGICEEGFVIWYRNIEVIKWKKIKLVTIRSSKSIKVELKGKFMDKYLRFNLKDYEKVFNIIKENIPYYADIKIIKYENISF